MTADLVNLRRARKAKARIDAADTAAGNRAKFGRSGAEQAVQAMSAAMEGRRLDGHRLTGARLTGACLTGARGADDVGD